ncbi:MAG: conserved phage C-terminal domain-containing protein [Clostridia bacterium]|nr:conserved phage C-terminal domain-containing protein [Clostridia bacterium]
MAIYRNVHVSFWNDTKIIDEMTPEDRYFMLYILSNPHTNQVGCYEISIRDISKETGYTEESVKKLLERFEKKLKVAKYSKKTKELLIVNWYKYNWTSSPKVKACIDKELKSIKSSEFREFINNTCIPYIYPMDTHTQEEKEQEEEKNKLNYIYSEVIEYLNQKTSKNFKSNNQKTQKFIHARLNEGFSLEDFKKVIDTKTKEWKNDKTMSKYLRPETLFGTKFEGYLNEVVEYKPNKEDDSFEEYKMLERRFSNG